MLVNFIRNFPTVFCQYLYRNNFKSICCLILLNILSRYCSLTFTCQQKFHLIIVYNTVCGIEIINSQRGKNNFIHVRLCIIIYLNYKINHKICCKGSTGKFLHVKAFRCRIFGKPFFSLSPYFL